jgi:integrase
VVFTCQELARILERMDGTARLVAELLYGTGLRLIEALRLRVKDIDFERNEVLVRDGKGRKDRLTMLPRVIGESLTLHLQRVRALHDRDLAAGLGAVWLPDALARKRSRSCLGTRT